MKLKDFQDKFQRAILAGDDAVLKDIPDGPHETKENLLGIYRDAYVLRLIDVIGADHERLHTYLGDDSFRAMARAYIAANPSRHRNARWFAQRLPEFLRSHEPYAKQPVLSELAALLGAIPLAIATGPGSEIRRPLGITIVGGLLVSQVLTLYTTPVIYLLLDRLHRRFGGRRKAETDADAISGPLSGAPEPQAH